MTRRHALALAHGWLHLRHAGHGPPLVLLHPSPLSSVVMQGWIDACAPYASVYAFDTPGYGASDPLPAPPARLDDYVQVVLAACDRLGLGRFVLFGAATGAQIALRLALTAPARVAALFLDAACHFTPEQRRRVLRGYFPDLRPRADGSHLARIRHMAAALFTHFPWHSRHDAARLSRPPAPSALVELIAWATWCAGPDYHRAYRLAFAHEDAAHLAGVQVPTHILLWPDSVVLPYTRALLAHPLPDLVRALELPAGPARYGALAVELRRILAARSLPDGRPPPDDPRRCWLPSPWGALHLRQVGDTAPTRIEVHDLGSSSAALPLKSGGLYLDLPGHGESEDLPTGCAPPTAAQLSAFLHATRGDLPLVGHGAVAAWLAGRSVDVPEPERAERLAACPAGSHWWTAWHWARAQALWSPWWRMAASARPKTATELKPRRLDRRARDWVRAGPALAQWWGAFRG